VALVPTGIFPNDSHTDAACMFDRPNIRTEPYAWVAEAAVIRKAYLGIVVATGVKAGRPVWLEMVRDVGEGDSPTLAPRQKFSCLSLSCSTSNPYFTCAVHSVGVSLNNMILDPHGHIAQSLVHVMLYACAFDQGS
jgi:hypothetical protein